MRTADDEQIATLIKGGSDEAVAQLKLLNDMDPSKLEGLFLPLGEWITSQKASVEAFTPTSCTATALELFDDGLAGYDAIRKQFLSWRDWGAQGHAFPVGAPRETAAMFTAALAELEAQCPA